MQDDFRSCMHILHVHVQMQTNKSEDPISSENKRMEERQRIKSEKLRKFEEFCSSEGVRLCEAYKKAWEFCRSNWFPESHKLDWSGVSENWPCDPMSDAEWEKVLNDPANKMRNSGFILPVIRCCSEVVQAAFRSLLNFSVVTGMAAEGTKVYIRLAIPKNPEATQYRHLAIGYDIYCKHMEIYHWRTMDVIKMKGQGFIAPQVTSFMRNRSAADSNIVRKAVREDAEQARVKDPSVSLGVLATDQQKCYDSITDFLKRLVLDALGAPIMFIKVMLETSFLNRFRVRTTEGDTRLTDHENGERQGTVVSCDTIIFIGQLIVSTLRKRGLMYEMQLSESVIDPDDLGCFYVDDQEWHCRGREQMEEVIEILCFFSAISCIGLNGPDKSSFSLWANAEKMVDEIKMTPWDRDNETLEETSIGRLRGNTSQKSLGIMLGETADVHEWQDPVVSRKIHAALSRVALKRLTRIEMQTLMTSVGLTSILFDPLGTNARLQTIRAAQRRMMQIASRSFAFRQSDRKLNLYCPVALGGNAQRYLIAEHVVALVRELTYYLNSPVVAGECALARYHAAKITDCIEEISNFIREAIHKLAICGIHIRDRDEELISRILDFMASWRSRPDGVTDLKPEFASWLQPEDPPQEVVNFLTKFSFDSRTASRLRQIFSSCLQKTMDQKVAVQEFAKCIVEDLIRNRSEWDSFLSDNEIGAMHRAVKWAVESMLQDWKNCFMVYWKDSVDGNQLQAYCPEFPDDGYMHTAGEEGAFNVQNAVLKTYRNMPSEESSSTKLSEGRECYTDGSYNPDTGSIGCINTS
jgi:hypothetical protein